MGITSPHRHEQKIMQMKVTSEQAKQLLTDQLSVWESARDNYKALEAVQVKELTVEGCTVKIQFNPARIVSSAAKVDTQSLKERNLSKRDLATCFAWHRPPNITYYSITAPNAEHRPQIMLISKPGTKDFYLSKRS